MSAMKKTIRTWACLVLGLLAAAAAAWIAPDTVYRAHGILLPAREIRAPIGVGQVLRVETAPIEAQPIGSISIERHYSTYRGSAPLLAEQEIWDLAAYYAAQVGANTIVINNLRLGQVTKNRFIYLFQATAYYVPLN